jgi:tripartite-type tricarboxylate transporter receptor subunit TctC
MLMIRPTSLGAIALAAVALPLAGANAAGFPEKDITFVIPYGPGGGFDTYVRKFAPEIEKFLPNKVNVVPKNIQGGGGRKALSQVYRAKPDGYTIAIYNMPGMLLDKILGKKANFDIEKFTWISKLAHSPYVLAVGAKGKYKTFKDLKAAANLKYAVTSPSSTSYVAGKILAAATGLNVTFLPGYKGSSAISLSLIRGDTQLSLFADNSYNKYAKGGDVIAVLSLDEKSPYKGVPTVGDIGQGELTALATERIVGAPPGTPKEIIKILETAFIKAAASAPIQDWAKKTDQVIKPLTTDETNKRVAHLMKFYGKYKEVLAKKK